MNTHLSALLASTIAGSALLFGAAAAQATALPTCSQPSNCLVFGDFSVYSLPFLNFNATGSTSQTPSNPYYVASSPGQISDYIVYGTGTNNNGVNNNPAGMDNAETMPTGGSPSYFSTQIVPDPTGDTFVGDAATTWDARVSSIRDYLTTNNSDFVIYFNLNETGQSDQLDGLNMLAWAEFTLKDDDGLLPDLHYFLTGPSSYFDATGSASALSLSASNGGPTVNTTADGGVDASDTRWTELHGWICVNETDGSLIGLNSCATVFSGQAIPSYAKDIKQNLGANQAAFAIYNNDLNSMLLSSDYDLLSIDYRLSYMDNGYEQAFSIPTTVTKPTTPPTEVPEPSALALFGAGLAALGVLGRRRARK